VIISSSFLPSFLPSFPLSHKLDVISFFSLSMLDLVSDGSSWEEIVTLAQSIEAAGASIINTGPPLYLPGISTSLVLGIGWHEARIPTIATMVPRGAFAWVTSRLKGSVNIPLVTTNRINTPEVLIALQLCLDLILPSSRSLIRFFEMVTQIW
jgi:2,4-dienoyl-CoA reductase (NADPH2)